MTRFQSSSLNCRGAPRAEAGVVEEDVEIAKGVERGGDHAVAVGAVADIGVHVDGFAAVLLDEAVDARGAGLTVVGAGNAGAFAREEARRGAADAAVGAGDEGDLALQAATAGPEAGMLVGGSGLHGGTPSVGRAATRRCPGLQAPTVARGNGRCKRPPEVI